MPEFYDPPKKSPPFGLSDNLTILICRKVRQTIVDKCRVVKTRDIRPSNKNALGRVLSEVNWSCLDGTDSCEEKLMFFIR